MTDDDKLLDRDEAGRRRDERSGMKDGMLGDQQKSSATVHAVQYLPDAGKPNTLAYPHLSLLTWALPYKLLLL